MFFVNYILLIATLQQHNNEMAYRNQTTTQRTQRPRECKVCIDAGKPEEEYTSHWVKDRSGNVTCPTLLNQKCLMCGNCGHTSSYCKVQIDSRPKLSATAVARATTAIAVKTKPVARPMSSNKYALLAIVEQDEARTRDRHTALFPPLEKKPEITRPTITITTNTTTSPSTWASRINSPPSQPQQPHQEHQDQPFRTLPRRPTRPMQIAVSWADQCCD